MSEDALPTKVRLGTPTQPVRLSFPNLFRPHSMEEGKEGKYGATFLIPLDYDTKALKGAMLAAARNKWGPEATELIKSKKIKLPLRNQEEKSHLAGYTEGWFLPTSSKNKPGVVDSALQPVLDPAEAVSGMLVIASLNAYAWEHPMKGKGVSFGLQNLMIWKDDGTRYGGVSPRPEEDFSDIKSSASSGAQVESADDIF